MRLNGLETFVVELSLYRSIVCDKMRASKQASQLAVASSCVSRLQPTTKHSALRHVQQPSRSLFLVKTCQTSSVPVKGLELGQQFRDTVV